MEGVEVKFKNCLYPVLISPNRVHEMITMSVEEKGLKVGAAVTLTALEIELKKLVKALPGNQ
jgi:xanthine dehydrogenase/oxidase